MDEILMCSIQALNLLVEECNSKNSNRDKFKIQLQLFNSLCDIEKSIQHGSPEVVLQVSSAIENFLIIALKGKNSSILFTDGIRCSISKCVTEVYCKSNVNPSNLIAFCLKSIPSRCQSCVRLTCLDILFTLLQNQNQYAYEWVEDIFVLVSKFTKYALNHEMSRMLQIINLLVSDASIVQSSPKIASMIPSVYKAIGNCMQHDLDHESQNHIIDIVSNLPPLAISQGINLSSDMIIHDIMSWLHQSDERSSSYTAQAVATILSRFVLQESREKTEESIMHTHTGLNRLSFESLCSMVLDELEQSSSKQLDINVILVMISAIEICRDRIVEHDITALLTLLQQVLKRHPTSSNQALMEAVVTEGICRFLPESYVSNLFTTFMNGLQQMQLQTNEEEVVAVTFLRILTKVIPLLGEAVTSEWKTHTAVLLPFLQAPSVAIQMTAHRCLLVLVTIDPTLIESLVMDLTQILSTKMDEIESTQSLERDTITGLCKAIGNLLLFQRSKSLELSADARKRLTALCERLASLNQVFMLSAEDRALQAVMQSTFQCLLEGMWYIQQGRIVFQVGEKEMKEMVEMLNDHFKQTVNAMHHQSYNDRFILSLQLVYPIMQTLFVALHCQPELFQMQLLTELMESFHQLSLLLVKAPSEPIVKRLVVLYLHTIDSLPSSFLAEGMEDYITLTLATMLECKERCTLEKVLMKETHSFMERPKTIAYQRYLTVESICTNLEVLNEMDVEDESFFILLNKLFPVMGVAPISIPSALLLEQRFANAAVHTISHLLIFVQNPDRYNITVTLLREFKNHDVASHNLFCLLWYFTHMAMEYQMLFEDQEWVTAMRDCLVSGFSHADDFTRCVAVQALAQLVAVMERPAKIATMAILERILNEETLHTKVVCSIHCCCAIYSLQRTNSIISAEDLKQMVSIKLEDDIAHQLGCLQALPWFIENNPVIHSVENMQWIIQVLQRMYVQPMELDSNREVLQLAWLEAFCCFCEEIQAENLDSIQSDLSKLVTVVDSIWEFSTYPAIQKACLTVYARLYPICPSLTSSILCTLRLALQSPVQSLRVTAILQLTTLWNTSSSSLTEAWMEDLPTLLQEVMVCCNRCVMENHSHAINACSDLFIQIITATLQSMQSPTVSSLWSLLCLITAPAMRDAPLAPLDATVKSDIPPGTANWMWQTLLLSLEGAYLVIQQLLKLLTPETDTLPVILSELVGFACYNITINYESASIEGFQLLGLELLQELLQTYGMVPDIEDTSKKFFTQFELRMITAIRGVITKNSSAAALSGSITILKLLLSHHIIIDASSIERLVTVLIPSESATQQLHITQLKAEVLAMLVYEARCPFSNYDSFIRTTFLKTVMQHRAIWFQFFMKDLVENPVNCYYLVAAAYLVSQETAVNDIVLLIHLCDKCMKWNQSSESMIAAMLALQSICESITLLGDRSFIHTFIEFCMAVSEIGLAVKDGAIHSTALALFTTVVNTLLQEQELRSRMQFTFQKKGERTLEKVQRALLFNRVSPFIIVVDEPEITPEEPKEDTQSVDSWGENDDWEKGVEEEFELKPPVTAIKRRQSRWKSGVSAGSTPLSPVASTADTSMIPAISKPVVQVPAKPVIKVKPGREVHTGFSDDEEEEVQLQTSRRRGRKGMRLSAYLSEETKEDPNLTIPTETSNPVQAPVAPLPVKKEGGDSWSDDEDWDAPSATKERVVEQTALKASWSESEEEIPLPSRQRRVAPQLATSEYVLQYDSNCPLMRSFVHCVQCVMTSSGDWLESIPVIRSICEFFDHHEVLNTLVCQRSLNAFFTEPLIPEQKDALIELVKECTKDSLLLRRAVWDAIVKSMTSITEQTLPLNKQSIDLFHAISSHPMDEEAVIDLADLYMSVFSSHLLKNADPAVDRFRLGLIPAYLQSMALLSNEGAEKLLHLTGLNVVMFFSRFLPTFTQEETEWCVQLSSMVFTTMKDKDLGSELVLTLLGRSLGKVSEWSGCEKMMEVAGETVFNIAKENAELFKSLTESMESKEREILQKVLKSTVDKKKRNRKKGPIKLDVSVF